MKDILKWIGVLPVAIIALIVSNALWRILHGITSSSYIEPDSWMNIILVEVMSAGISSASFIYAGTWLAPKYKKETALVLFIILIMTVGASFFAANFLTGDYFSNIGLISGIIGAAACYIDIQNDVQE
jgi:hypothetical protein